MTFTSYEIFINEITDRIVNLTGFKLSTASKISQDLVKNVRAQGKIIGKGFVVPHNTLRQFLNVLNRSTFSQSSSALEELIKKYNNVNCIEALNAFVELYPEGRITLRKKLWKSDRTKIKNDSSSIKQFALREWNRLQNLEFITLTELRKNILAAATIQNVLGSFVIATGAFVADNEVVVGLIPLGGMGIGSPTSVQEIEVTHSDKKVKFRAVGTIFLAHQPGGKDSISITGQLTGPLRMFWLTALWYLSLLSQGSLEAITDPKILTSLRTGSGDLISLSKLPMNKRESIVTQKPAYEKHITFPVVTTHEIIPNCYIETFSFEEKTVNDRNVIYYDLLLRTYEEPDEFIANSDQTVFRQAKSLTKSEQVIKYAINFTYRMMKYARETFNVETNAWKTDNYYEVDVLDMATVFSLSLTGLI